MSQEHKKKSGSGRVGMYHDAQAKSVIRNRYVIAWTLKCLVDEYKDMDVEDIVRGFGGPPDARSLRGVDKENIVGGTILSISDSRFLIKGSEGRPGILLDVEVQAGNRGMEQLNIRMFSTLIYTEKQERILEKEEGMQDKNLIVSVWIVVFPPKEYANSVQEFVYANRTIGMTVGNKAARQFAVCLGELKDGLPDIVRIYDLLFRVPQSEERTAMLKRLNIDIPLVTQEDTDMLSYSESLKEYGREEGIEMGIRRQMSKYMENGHSFDEAFDLFAEPGMDREEVRKELLS